MPKEFFNLKNLRQYYQLSGCSDLRIQCDCSIRVVYYSSPLVYSISIIFKHKNVHFVRVDLGSVWSVPLSKLLYDRIF